MKPQQTVDIGSGIPDTGVMSTNAECRCTPQRRCLHCIIAEQVEAQKSMTTGLFAPNAEREYEDRAS